MQNIKELLIKSLNKTWKQNQVISSLIKNEIIKTTKSIINEELVNIKNKLINNISLNLSNKWIIIKNIDLKFK